MAIKITRTVRESMPGGRTFYTTLPCFPGFYESPLSLDTENAIDALVEYHTEGDGFFRHRLPTKLVARYFERAEEEQLISFDYEGYQESCARKFCHIVEDCLNEILQGYVRIDFKEIHSPKFYNFETDRVACNITFEPESALDYTRKHYPAFSRYIRESFTTRSGFISFMSNNPADWLDPAEWDDRHPGVILDFILRNEIPDTEVSLSERVLDFTYGIDYVSLPPAIKQFLESAEAAKIGKEYLRLMEQGDEYLRLMGEKYCDEVLLQKERVTNELVDEMLEAVSRLEEELEPERAKAA